MSGAWSAVAAATIAAGASAYGSSQQSKAAKAGNAMAGGSPEAGAAMQSGLLQQPYTDLGYNALTPYQFLLTGQAPQVDWTKTDESRYADLRARENELSLLYAQYTGPGSMRSNYRKVRSAQESANKIKAQLDELAKLRQQRSVYNAMKTGGMSGGIQGYIEQDPRYKAMMTSGQRAMDRYGAAKGTLGYHGPTSGQLIRNFELGSNVASSVYGNKLNDLYTAIQVGRGAATAQGGYGIQGAQATGNSMQQLGRNMAAQGQQEGANWANLGAIPMNALSAYNQYKAYQQPPPQTAAYQPTGNVFQPTTFGGNGPLMSYGN